MRGGYILTLPPQPHTSHTAISSTDFALESHITRTVHHAAMPTPRSKNPYAPLTPPPHPMHSAHGCGPTAPMLQYQHYHTRTLPSPLPPSLPPPCSPHALGPRLRPHCPDAEVEQPVGLRLVAAPVLLLLVHAEADVDEAVRAGGGVLGGQPVQGPAQPTVRVHDSARWREEEGGER